MNPEEAMQKKIAQFETDSPLQQVVIKFVESIYHPVLKKTLEEHGCVYTQTTETSANVIFPPNTTKTELWPRTRAVRYRINLPDKYDLHLYEIQDGKVSFGFPEDVLLQVGTEGNGGIPN